MNSGKSVIKGLGDIVTAKNRRMVSPDEMIDPDEIRGTLYPNEWLLQILRLCAELPEVGDHKIHAKAGLYLKMAEGEVGGESNVVLGEIIGGACYAIAGWGEKMEEEAMRYAIAAVCPEGASREFAEIILKMTVSGKTGTWNKDRFYLSVMSFYYYRIARAGARKGDEEQGKERGN